MGFSLFLCILLFIYVCICMCSAHLCSEDNLQEVSALLSPRGSQDQGQVVRLGSKCLSHWAISQAPSCKFFKSMTLQRYALSTRMSWIFSFHGHRGNIYPLQKNQVSRDLKRKGNTTPCVACWSFSEAYIRERCFTKLCHTNDCCFCLLALSQSLTVQPRLASNTQSHCLGLLRALCPSVSHHTQTNLSVYKVLLHYNSHLCQQTYDSTPGNCRAGAVFVRLVLPSAWWTLPFFSPCCFPL